METFYQLLDFILNLNEHLASLVNDVDGWVYLILFIIIFAETGLIIMPFLPGDSLLFVAGSIATVSKLDVHLLVIVLIIGAILGNTVNYIIGRWLGKKLFCHPKLKFFSQLKLAKAHNFYEKYGGLTVILSRFLPIVRTFVPFIAGMAEMSHSRFTFFNIVGAVAWICFFVYGGFFFGKTALVQNNFGLFILIVICLTLLPFIIGLIRNLIVKR